MIRFSRAAILLTASLFASPVFAWQLCEAPLSRRDVDAAIVSAIKPLVLKIGVTQYQALVAEMLRRKSMTVGDDFIKAHREIEMQAALDLLNVIESHLKQLPDFEVIQNKVLITLAQNQRKTFKVQKKVGVITKKLQGSPITTNILFKSSFWNKNPNVKSVANLMDGSRLVIGHSGEMSLIEPDASRVVGMSALDPTLNHPNGNIITSAMSINPTEMLILGHSYLTLVDFSDRLIPKFENFSPRLPKIKSISSAKYFVAALPLSKDRFLVAGSDALTILDISNRRRPKVLEMNHLFDAQVATHGYKIVHPLSENLYLVAGEEKDPNLVILDLHDLEQMRAKNLYGNYIANSRYAVNHKRPPCVKMALTLSDGRVLAVGTQGTMLLMDYRQGYDQGHIENLQERYQNIQNSVDLHGAVEIAPNKVLAFGEEVFLFDLNRKDAASVKKIRHYTKYQWGEIRFTKFLRISGNKIMLYGMADNALFLDFSDLENIVSLTLSTRSLGITSTDGAIYDAWMSPEQKLILIGRESQVIEVDIVRFLDGQG